MRWLPYLNSIYEWCVFIFFSTFKKSLFIFIFLVIYIWFSYLTLIYSHLFFFILLLILIDIILIAIWLTLFLISQSSILFLLPDISFLPSCFQNFLLTLVFSKLNKITKYGCMHFLYIHSSFICWSCCLFNFLKLSDVILNQIWKKKLASFSWNSFLLLYFSHLRFQLLEILSHSTLMHLSLLWSE